MFCAEKSDWCTKAVIRNCGRLVKKEVDEDGTKHNQRPEEVAKRSERPAKCLWKLSFWGLILCQLRRGSNNN